MAKSLHKLQVAENLAMVVAVGAEAKGKSQADFARSVDVSPSKLGNWLRGDNYPDPYTMVKVCDLYGVSMEWIYRRRLFGLDESVAAGLREAAKAFSGEAADGDNPARGRKPKSE